jgi:hypothetical protein
VFFNPDEDKPVPIKSERFALLFWKRMERAETPEVKIREVLRKWENNEPWMLGRLAAKAGDQKFRCPSGAYQSDRGKRPAGGPARKKSRS